MQDIDAPCGLAAAHRHFVARKPLSIVCKWNQCDMAAVPAMQAAWVAVGAAWSFGSAVAIVARAELSSRRAGGAQPRCV
jgi:hypothetical protein